MSGRSERSVSELLDDILIWGARIPQLLGDMSFDDFRQDYRTHLAVWKCIEVVGEASGHLLKRDLTFSLALKEELRSAYRMRNRLSHGYPGVDLAILWTTAKHSLPSLVDLARSAILARDEQGS